jgi:hypothetical protein
MIGIPPDLVNSLEKIIPWGETSLPVDPNPQFFQAISDDG